MKVHWRDYSITINKYSYDLHTVKYVTEENKKSHAYYNRVVGDEYLTDEGFFTNLDTLLNKLIRLESMKMDNDTIEIGGFLAIWTDLISNFGEEIKILKEEES